MFGTIEYLRNMTDNMQILDKKVFFPQKEYITNAFHRDVKQYLNRKTNVKYIEQIFLYRIPNRISKYGIL